MAICCIDEDMTTLTDEQKCDTDSDELTRFLSNSNLYDVGRNFELGVCLGNGANAAAYDAFITSTGQKCVVKVFNDTHGTSSQHKVLRTLRGEDHCFTATAGKSNKFVRSFGYYCNDVQQFLFYEKMDCSLNDYHLGASFDDKKPQVISIAYDLFVAISHLHVCGYHHKDVHIQNVLMIGKHAKLADLESVGPSPPNSNQWIKISLDIRAVGYIMCQLITGKTGMDWYPGERDAAWEPTERQQQKYLQLRNETNEIIGDDDVQLIFLINTVLDCDTNACENDNFSAKKAWEFLNKELSPRFHGRIESATNLDEDGQGNLIYLDRHRVFVADYASALKSFRLVRDENTIGFKFCRQRILNAPVSSLSTKEYCTEVRDHENYGKIFDLNGLEVNPPSSHRRGFLKGFHLVRESNMTSFKICYTLLEGGGVWTDEPQEKFTKWNDAGGGKTYYLDRHEVRAREDNYAITGFTIETNPEQTQIRFKYLQQQYI